MELRKGRERDVDDSIRLLRDAARRTPGLKPRAWPTVFALSGPKKAP
jgi:hypothetical protein